MLWRTLFRINSFLGTSLDHIGVVDHYLLAPLFATEVSGDQGLVAGHTHAIWALHLEYALDQCLKDHTSLGGPRLCVTELVPPGQVANTRQDYYSK